MLYLIPFQRDQAVELASGEQTIELAQVVLILGLSLGVAGFLVAVDIFLKPKRLTSLSGIFLGLLAGMLVTYALSFVIDLIGVIATPSMTSHSESFLDLLQGAKVFVGLISCYICISLVLQTKDDFRFIIPYVEFARQVRGTRPILLDTSVIIDGRIVDIIDTQVVQGSLVVPRFVLNELQQLADSSDKLRRARGRRGLEILQKLQDNQVVEVSIEDREVSGANVDQKLLSVAREYNARVMTNDYNLNKVATLRGVDVINLNDLAKALRPVVLPGETMRVKVIRPGESTHQGVGYLEDGTMVVVENGRGLMGQEAELVVTSTLQTSAGRMIFGRASNAPPEGEHAAPPSHPEPPRSESENGPRRGDDRPEPARSTIRGPRRDR